MYSFIRKVKSNFKKAGGHKEKKLDKRIRELQLNYKVSILTPKISSTAFVAPDAWILGDVEICDYASVWFQCVLRGDAGKIFIGEASNIQDGCIIHEGANIGKEVTVGHGAVLHCCSVGNGVVVGARSVVWDKAEIGDECLVGVGAVVPPGMKVPPRTMVVGLPAKEKRTLTDEEVKFQYLSAEHYRLLAQDYKKLF